MPLDGFTLHHYILYSIISHMSGCGCRTIASVVDDYTLVGFLPLDPNDEETIDNVLMQADMVSRMAVQWVVMRTVSQVA
jgi:hypothetical protein